MKISLHYHKEIWTKNISWEKSLRNIYLHNLTMFHETGTCEHFQHQSAM